MGSMGGVFYAFTAGMANQKEGDILLQRSKTDREKRPGEYAQCRMRYRRVYSERIKAAAASVESTMSAEKIEACVIMQREICRD